MNKKELIEIINECNRKYLYFAIVVKKDFEKNPPEIIINHPTSAISKAKYYEKSYNDDCCLVSNNGIRIVDIYTGSTLNEIYKKIIENDTNFM